MPIVVEGDPSWKGPPSDVVDSGGEPPDNGEMQARIAKLEAVLPTLATKEDLARLEGSLKGDMARLDGALRTELHKGFAEQTKWILGTAIGGIAVFVTVMTFVLNNAVPKAPAQQLTPQIIVVPTPAAKASGP